MNTISWILLGLLVAYCVFVLVRRVQKLKKGRGCGCGCGDCPMKDRCLPDREKN